VFARARCWTLLNLPNPAHPRTPYFSKIHYNNYMNLPPTPRSPKWSLNFRFSNLVPFMRSTCPPHYTKKLLRFRLRSGFSSGSQVFFNQWLFHQYLLQLLRKLENNNHKYTVLIKTLHQYSRMM
jgi:hypothetical protein